MIAKAFETYRNNDMFLIFASGVSDSTRNNPIDFKREKSLLEQHLHDAAKKVFVYFSTCSIYDPAMQQSAYVLHKLAMEEMIRQSHGNYYIFRLSNAVGHTGNPTTIINFLVNHIISGAPFQAWVNASRNVIDVEDARTIVDRLLMEGRMKCQTINIANPFNDRIPEMIASIEQHVGKKGNYQWVNKGSAPVIDIQPIAPVISELNINFGSNYLPRLLQKYYPII